MSVINTHNFGRFCSVSCTITQHFRFRERFPRLMIPGVRLCVRHQYSKFWPILTRLVDYYSPFWCPEVISIVVEPQGALMCRSSTLAVLADSGFFHGLLLTVLGSQMISMVVEHQGVLMCWSSRLAVWADSSRGLLLTLLGSRCNFHV